LPSACATCAVRATRCSTCEIPSMSSVALFGPSIAQPHALHSVARSLFARLVRCFFPTFAVVTPARAAMLDAALSVAWCSRRRCFEPWRNRLHGSAWPERRRRERWW
jgi:hypothetical protein